MPRLPWSSAEPFSSCNISRTSAGATGSSRNAMSCRTSTQMPPSPTAITGPHCASLVTPTCSSSPALRIGATNTPCTAAPGGTRACTAWKARATAASPSRFNATPPISLLWVMSAEAIFSATRPPKPDAAERAAVSSRARTMGTTGTPQRASQASASCSDVSPGRDVPARLGVQVVAAAAPRRARSDHQKALPRAARPRCRPPAMKGSFRDCTIPSAAGETGLPRQLITRAGMGESAIPAAMCRQPARFMGSVASRSASGRSVKQTATDNPGSCTMTLSVDLNRRRSRVEAPVMSSGFCGVP